LFEPLRYIGLNGRPRASPTHRSSRIVSPIRLAILVLVASFLAGCGDESGPDPIQAPPTPPLEIESGTFTITSWENFNGCNKTTDYDGTYQIQIDGSNFSMGDDWPGTWDPNTLEGTGESVHDQNTYKSCIVTTWTTVNIEFSSKNEFSGHITYRQRVAGTCENFGNCTSTWGISGVRQ
jgi:hypothetical protein